MLNIFFYHCWKFIQDIANYEIVLQSSKYKIKIEDILFIFLILKLQ